VPKRFNRLVRWRIFPSSSLLDTIKYDHHEPPLWNVTLEWRDFAATNQVFTVKGRQGARYSRPVFLECGWVINFKFRDDIAGRNLDLLRADSVAASNANRDASREESSLFCFALKTPLAVIPQRWTGARVCLFRG
jgi:hypothetical protein